MIHRRLLGLRRRVSPQAQGPGWGETSSVDSTGMKEPFPAERTAWRQSGATRPRQDPAQCHWPRPRPRPKEGQCRFSPVPAFRVLKGFLKGRGGDRRASPAKGLGTFERERFKEKVTLKYSSQGERERGVRKKQCPARRRGSINIC